MTEKETLISLRAEIDEIDRALVPLLAARMDVARRIARWKAKNGIPVSDAGRESEKLAALTALCPEESKALGTIYRDSGIFAASREAQEAEQDRDKICFLLGEHLTHSYSPALHAGFGYYFYGLHPLPPEEVADFVRQGNWAGLNITIPYKKAVLPLCDELSPTAARLGSVNTLVRKNGKICGDNTDAYGFSSLLAVHGIRPAGRKALVLGDGGAGITAATVLSDLGADVTIISRHGADTYETLPAHRDAELIVNATPVGMYPRNGETLLHPADFPRCRWVVDLIYNPARTKLLLEAEEAGRIAVNGLWMLVAQGAKSAALFTGREIAPERIRAVYESLKQQMRNIILIGMPGCGKTTLAAELGQLTGRRVADSDEVYAARFGLSPAAAIETRGEAFFRAGESEVLAALCKESGGVIATGGGSVLLHENEALLRQNSFVVWVRRPADALSREGRPLSEDIQTLAKVREPIYARLADCVVENAPGRTPKEAAEEIWKQYRQNNCTFSS